MRKHIVPILNLILLIIVTCTILYNYSVGNQTEKIGWLVFGVLLLNTSFSYWKEFFTKSDENFKDEKSDGIHIELHTDFYEDGQKQSEVTFKDGKINGLVTYWYENGEKKSEGTYKNGKKDGLFTWWYVNGKKEYEGTYKNGRKISVKEWNEDGSVKE
jgi:antitoxin component YwqK of YwqJK toxin-antitoxin module